MQKQKLLVVENDEGALKQRWWSLDAFEVVVACNRESALTQVRRHQPGVVTLDLGLPPDANGASEGLAALEQILLIAPRTKVIVLSGNLDRTHALQAIAKGAHEFQQKPCDAALLRLVVARAFALHSMQQENDRMMQTTLESPLNSIVSRDPSMLKLCRSIEKIALSSASVMLLGESGCGKELLARAVHELSPRKRHRFVALNCAAIPHELLESELFGYEKGAFTGAGRRKLGKIEIAQGGTFFLDEIGDMDSALQAKLLRFLQERVIERIGGHTEIAVDVRILSATHRDLQALVREGRFREDLYYRLNEITLPIPPLRHRVGDAVLLAYHFRNRWCAAEHRSLIGFSEHALQAIDQHPWPGNVRELENAVKRAVIMCDGAQINEKDLGLPTVVLSPPSLNLRQARDAAEYLVMVQALACSGGAIVKAAELLGVSRPTLYDLMHHHGIDVTQRLRAAQATPNLHFESLHRG